MKRLMAIFLALCVIPACAFGQSPTPIVVTDKNGNQLTITGSTTGTQFGAPTPVVLTDKNGNVLVLGSGGGASFVSTGVTADCQLLEGSGTTTSCGVGGNGTFGATQNAPLWRGGASDPLFMDNFFSSLGANYTAVGGTFTVSSNKITENTGGTGGIWADAYVSGVQFPTGPGTTGTGSPANQWAQATMATLPTAGCGIGPAVRMSGATPTENFYAFHWLGPSTNQWRVFKSVSGTFTSLTTGTYSPTAGDVFYLQAQQTSNTTVTLIAKINGSTVATTTDTSLTVGYPGIMGDGTSNCGSASNFSAGQLNSTVSGGVLFGGGQNISLPASLNSARTLELELCYQKSSNTNSHNAPLQGNGNGAASNAIGIDLTGNYGGVNSPLTTLVPHFSVLGNNAITTGQFGVVNGCHAIIATLGSSSDTPATYDHTFIDGIEGSYVLSQQGQSAALQTVGNYFLGGTAASNGQTAASYYSGTIVRARLFSRAITPYEVQQDTTAMLIDMTSRNYVPFSGDQQNTGAVIVNGDSIGVGYGLSAGQVFTQLMTLTPPTNGCTTTTISNGITAATLNQLLPVATINPTPLFNPRMGCNVYIQQGGTNDLIAAVGIPNATQTLLQNVVSDIGAMRKNVPGIRTISTSLLSRTGTGDANKDAYNPIWRSRVLSFSDGSVDLGETTVLGADGASAGTGFQGDAIHPSAYGSTVLAFLVQREINRLLYGNHDFSSANIYTTTAASATATTAGSESGSTVTITMASNPFKAGQCVVISGVTPTGTGYNTATSGSGSARCWLVLTATATQITFTSSVTGLGAITVQGTVSTPTEQDVDLDNVVLAGSSAGPSYTLQTCDGQTGHTKRIEIQNTNATPWVLTGFGAETINGSGTMNAPVASATNHPIITLTAILTSNTAGGCSWQASL